MVKVRIKCPECNEIGYIEVRENLIADSQRGISAVNVAEDLVCPHSFIAYIDRNFDMRDAFTTDFKVSLPVINLGELDEMESNVLLEQIDLYLISINLHALSFMYIIRACLNDRKVLIINDLDILEGHLKNFFNYIFNDTFKINISIGSLNFYKKNKKKYKEHIVIDKHSILNDKTNLMNPKQIKVEKAIVQKFLGEIDPRISLIILKNEIHKAYNLTRDIVQMNEILKDKEVLSSKQMLDNLESSYSVKIGKNYLDFLIGIVINYFKVNLKQATSATDLIKYF